MYAYHPATRAGSGLPSSGETSDPVMLGGKALKLSALHVAECIIDSTPASKQDHGCLGRNIEGVARNLMHALGDPFPTPTQRCTKYVAQS